jgi:3-phenylpropionate/trans-cinnamate dioxygenase ferredoxin component
VVCPRHGSRFEIASGRPLTLPAYLPVETYPVTLRDGIVVVEVP